LSRQTDQSDQPSTVPPAELNPLLNPVLAQNMGRWAEVYFTSPPEKREEAVSELLRELGGNPSAEGQAAAPVSDVNLQISSSQSSEAAYQNVCRSCGFQNPENQNFCGMCGTALSRAGHTGENRPTDVRPAEECATQAATQRHLDEIRFLPPEELTDESSVNPVREERTTVQQIREAESRAEENYGDHSSADQYPYSWVDRYRDQSREHQFSFESDRPSFAYSYRMFVGAGLAIVIVVLAYMAWRSGQAASNLSPQSPQTNGAQSSAAQPANQSDAAASGAEGAKPVEARPTEKTASTNEQPAIAGAKPVTQNARLKPSTEHSAASETNSAATQTKVDPFAERVGTGAEELALAQRYLNGQGGQGRDPSQAAEWLWKAVAKQNTDATVLLSDLYLKGDGIAKNCDQARVLLDAAARRGRTDASDRLQHLQSFGCQ